MATKGVDVVGPIPQELQVYVSFAGAIRSQAAQPAGARELLKFIAEPNTALISG
jgi:molybdate transport system substrate-binding protein